MNLTTVCYLAIFFSIYWREYRGVV